MGLVAFTLGFLALGAYIGRDLTGGIGILFFIAAFACRSLSTAPERMASSRPRFCSASACCSGWGSAPCSTHTRRRIRPRCGRPPARPAGSSRSLGTAGYATRRDLSSWARVLFWALLALLVFGIVAIFVSIPQANLIWSVAGLVIFGGYTILDFNRLRRTGPTSTAPIAASIFLDVLNVFLFFLELFGGE